MWSFSFSGDSFVAVGTSHRSSVHDLVLGDGVVLVVHGRARSCRFTPDDVYFHVSDLDPHQQEEDLSHNHIFNVVSAGRDGQRGGGFC